MEDILESNTLIPCLTSRLSFEIRENWKSRYRYMKKYGIRAGFAGITGTGYLTIVKEATKDSIKRHGKRYIGSIMVTCGLTSLSAGVPLITNTTKVVKYAKSTHSVCAAAWRASHNIAELPLMALDYAIFGEYISSCGETDYDLYGFNVTDFVDTFSK